jgi:hypothetical protein
MEFLLVAVLLLLDLAVQTLEFEVHEAFSFLLELGLEIHALGRVTVRIRKVGRSWDPAPWTHDGYQPNTDGKTFRLRNRGLIQTGLGTTQDLTCADIRYLVDVRLR